MRFLSKFFKKQGEENIYIKDEEDISIGDYAVIIWSDEDDKSLIHPDDLISVIEYHKPDGFIFQSIVRVIGFEDNYVVVKGVDFIFRMKLEALSKKPTPKCHIGDCVVILTGSKKGNAAVIYDLTWHYKRKKMIYTLKYQGYVLKRGRWYFDEDLELC